MSDQRDDLRSYLLQIARNLVARGVVRRQQGQTIEAVLVSELPRVLSEVQQDFWFVVGELGAGFVQSGAQAIGQSIGRSAQHEVNRLVGAGVQAVTDALSRLGGNRR